MSLLGFGLGLLESVSLEEHDTLLPTPSAFLCFAQLFVLSLLFLLFFLCVCVCDCFGRLERHLRRVDGLMERTAFVEYTRDAMRKGVR